MGFNGFYMVLLVLIAFNGISYDNSYSISGGYWWFQRVWTIFCDRSRLIAGINVTSVTRPGKHAKKRWKDPPCSSWVNPLFLSISTGPCSITI